MEETLMFQRALDYLLIVEGGFVNDPADPGGATNYGITQGTYDAWRDNVERSRQPVEDITTTEVRQIYYNQYWVPGRCASLQWPLSLLHFDACVNLGRPDSHPVPFSRSWAVMQRALQVTDDGRPGPITMRSAGVLRNSATLIYRYAWERLWVYRDLTRNKSLAKFLPSWIWRLDKLIQAAIPSLHQRRI